MHQHDVLGYFDWGGTALLGLGKGAPSDFSQPMAGNWNALYCL
jgi:hypothetical protein